MPKIPVYQQQIAPRGPGYAANARGGQFASIAPRLNALAGALEDIGRQQDAEAKERALEAKRQEIQAAEVWAAQATSEWDLARHKAMVDARDKAEPGGKDFAKNYLDDYDKQAPEWEKNAPNDLARQKFRAHSARTREAYGKQAYEFESAERERDIVERLNTGVQASALLVRANPALFDSEAGKYASAMKSLDPKLRADAQAGMVKALATEAALGFVDANPATAKQNLEFWRKSHAPGDPAVATFQIDGREWRVPVGMLKPGEIDQVVRHAEQKHTEFKERGFAAVAIESAKGAVASAPLLPGDIVDIPQVKAEAIKRAKALSGGDIDPTQAERIESAVEKAAGDRERDIRRAKASNTAAATAAIEQNGGDYQAAVQARPELFSGMDPKTKAELNEYAGKVSTGALIETDWQAYGELVDNPALLKSANLDSMKHKFDAGTFAQLKKMQEKIKAYAPAEQNILGNKALIDGLLEQAGFAGKNNKDARSRAYALIQGQIDVELAESGKKELPQSRIKEITKEQLQLRTKKGNIWIFPWDTKYTDAGVVVPEAEIPKITAGLRMIGAPVNEWTIKQAWLTRFDPPRFHVKQQNSPIVQSIPE